MPDPLIAASEEAAAEAQASADAWLAAEREVSDFAQRFLDRDPDEDELSRGAQLERAAEKARQRRHEAFQWLRELSETLDAAAELQDRRRGAALLN